MTSKTDSLRSRVFDAQGWSKNYVEGALIHDLWDETERQAKALASCFSFEEQQRTEIATLKRDLVTRTKERDVALAKERAEFINSYMQENLGLISQLLEASELLKEWRVEGHCPITQTDLWINRIDDAFRRMPIGDGKPWRELRREFGLQDEESGCICTAVTIAGVLTHADYCPKSKGQL